MRKSRYTETQIITILKAVEAGRTVKDVWREYGISDATYYNWKSKYSGMVDDFNREILGIEIDLNLPSNRVMRTLERITV